MAGIRVSLIIVSRDRPDDLAACLSCLRFQSAQGVETIVVSNLPLPDGPAPNPLIHIDCPEANISRARNLGLARAQGDYIVFCDDDCLPDPDFIARITAPLADPRIGAAGGLSRGSNGVSLQWGAAAFGRDGIDYPLKLDRDAPYTVFPPRADRFVKTVGTACAFRADALRSIGGFDAAFRFYFDETDVNVRLSEAGWATAIVPGAQVHHAFAAGPHRNGRRVPRDMFEIGASTARFVRLYCPEGSAAALATHRRNLRKRVMQRFTLGLCDGAHLRFLLRRIDEGLAFGQADQTPPPCPATTTPPMALDPVATRSRNHFLLLGGLRQMRPLAQKLVQSGQIVTVLSLGASARPLWVRFDADGFWHHSGGVFGRIQRKDPVFNLRSKRHYLRLEQARLASFRSVNYLISPQKMPGTAPILPELRHIVEMRGMNLRAVLGRNES